MNLPVTKVAGKTLASNDDNTFVMHDIAGSRVTQNRNSQVLLGPYVAANGLEMINDQYWALSNTMLDFYESWINWRRTGFPILTPVVYPNNATNGTIPRRFPYPVTEATDNPVNLKAAQDALPQGDNLTSRVWWDVE